MVRNRRTCRSVVVGFEMKFIAEDGYSYLIDVKGRNNRSYRIDSGILNITLGTNETLEIKRLDITPEVSSKLGMLNKKFL